MSLDSKLYDAEKYQLKWLRVLDCVRRLGSSHMYANYVLFNYYCFNNMIEHVD